MFCGFTPSRLYFKMFFGCALVLYWLSLHYGSSVANYESHWISSPNLSPFHKLLMTNGKMDEMCPSLVDGDCVLSSRSRTHRPAHSTGDGTSSADNISSALGSTIPVDGAGPFSADKGVLDGGKGGKLEEVPSISQSTTSDQPPIVTFDEWTKEKLKQEGHRKNHIKSHKQTVKPQGTNAGSDTTVKADEGSGVPSVVPESTVHLNQETAQRNYASRECGAKVLFSNDEAENKNAVLNEKERDDYMRNPCGRAQHKWLVIELCETIMPTALELANFELFSSGPQKVRLSGSERYPSNEWVTLSEVNAEDSRNIQRFPLTNSRVYAKFIRVELLTHHGNEHYCTLSMIRVMGISMVDEYEAEADALSDESTQLSDETEEGVVVPMNKDAKQENVKQVESREDKETNASEVKSTEIKENETKTTSDNTIVDAVVSAVGNMGIRNIKDAFQSAFLGKWHGSAHHNNRQTVSLARACWSCPVADSFTIPLLACRAFFYRRERKERKKDVLTKDERTQPIVQQSKQFEHSSTSQTVKDTTAKREETSKRVNRSKKGSSKQFLHRVIVASVCKPGDCAIEELSGVDSINSISEGMVSTTSQPAQASTSSPRSQQPTAIPSSAKGQQTLPGASISHKESVFLKLNKRISALELNMSLSSEYLSELSRRYVEQTQDRHKHMDKVLKSAEDSAAKVARSVHHQLTKQVDDVGRELRELSRMVKSLASRSAVVESSLKARSTEPNPPRPCDSQTETHSHDDVIPHPQQHLLYSNDYVWTTEQLVYMVIAAQACTVVLMLILQCFYYRNQNAINESTIRDIVDDRIQHVLAQKSSQQTPISADRMRRVKRRRNNVTGQTECCSHEHGDNYDSAMESSARSMTPTPSDVSSEIELDSRIDVPRSPTSQWNARTICSLNQAVGGKSNTNDEHERTPTLRDTVTQVSSAFSQLTSATTTLPAGREGDSEEDGQLLPMAWEAPKTPQKQSAMRQTPPSSGHSWHLVKPSRRKNKRITFKR